MKPINQLTEQIIGAAIEVHRLKGPGLLESAYETRIVNERFVAEPSANSVLKSSIIQPAP
ncbi:MAG: GxxExxY protein [Lacunisphaera sp.]|nr:GxxExxY protein [Lacunisphaera sp.]